jgi:hypothetical protein
MKDRRGRRRAGDRDGGTAMPMPYNEREPIAEGDLDGE